MDSIAPFQMDGSTVSGKLTIVRGSTLEVTDSSLGSLSATKSSPDMSASFDRTRIKGDVTVLNQAGFAFYASTVAGSVSSTANLTLRQSTVKGSTTIDSHNAHVCGSRLADVTVPHDHTFHARFESTSLTIGSGDADCAGNTIKGNLDIVGGYDQLAVNQNTVIGRATSPDALKGNLTGSGNQFRGEVTGALTRLA